MRISRTRTSIIAAVLLCCLAGQARAELRKIGLVLGQKSYDHETEAAVLDAATQAFLRSKRFTVVEREALQSIFQEKGLKGFIGDTKGADITETEGLDWIGILTYTAEKGPDPAGGQRTVYVLSVRMLEVRTGRVLYVLDSRPESTKTTGGLRGLGHRIFARDAGAGTQAALGEMGATGADSFDAAGERLLDKILETFPPQGYVIDVVNPHQVVVDIGADQGLRQGDQLEIFSIGPTMIHPVTGVEIPGREIVEGQLKVQSVDAATATCKVRSSKGEVGVGARVRFEPKEGLLDRTLDRLPIGGHGNG